MFRLLFLFLILALSIALGPLIIGHQGQVTITTATHEYTTSITALCIAIIAVFILLFFLQWLLKRIYRFSSATTGWFLGRPHVRARKQTQLGLLKLIEGDYTKAQKLLSMSAPKSAQPTVNYLLAAEAALRANDILAVNQYLEQATLLAGNNQLAVELTRVRIQLATGGNVAATQEIDKLLHDQPRHPEVLRLARQAYLASGAYHSLLGVLPSMRKISLYGDSTLDSLEQQAYSGIMKKEVANGGADGLKRWLTTLSSKQRHKPIIVTQAAKLFIDNKDDDMAQQLIIDGLKQQYDQKLVNLITEFTPSQPEQLENLLRKLIKKQGSSAVLNSALGYLLIQRKDWQGAKECLEAALEQQANIKDYTLLAKAYDELSLSQQAIDAKNKALALALH